MDSLTLLILLFLGMYLLRRKEQVQRVRWLASGLARYPIERLMEGLMEGYLRALGDGDAQRSATVWRLMEMTEGNLAQQFEQFAADVARQPEALTRISTLPVPLPYADRWLPQATFDFRQLLRIHAEGIRRAAGAAALAGDARRRQAYVMSAELLLMQHSCHWFCKSRGVATLRLVARHQSTYEQVLASVSPQTRKAYRALVGMA